MSQAKFERYDAYKDSGIELLGEVPAHWKIRRIKEVGSIKYGLGQPPQYLEQGLPLIRATNIERGKIVEKGLVFISPEDVPYERNPVLKTNDIIVVRSGAYTADSAIVPETYDGAIAGYDMVLSPNQIEAKYLAYALLSNYVLKDQLILRSFRAAQPHLNKEELGTTLIFYPPLPEQTAIAAYLDTKTAQIDRKIDLLSQKATQYGQFKQALINETVTRGLDKTVPLKDSGVEWIGDVPAHWEVRRAKDLFDRKVRSCLDDDEIVTAFRDGQVTLRLNRRVDGFTNAIKEHGYQRIHIGDLVIHAMDAFAGAIGVSDSTGKSSPVYSAYSAQDEEKVYIPYYGKLLRQMALSGFISSLGKGIRERSTEFRHREFAPLELIVPPIEEQKSIATYLDEKTDHINHIIETIHAQIDKLKELRKTLINDVVTGKIKVVTEGQTP